MFKKRLTSLYFTQFLSAFADNMILFITLVMLNNQGKDADAVLPAVQAAFLLAYIVLAPVVGAVADKHPKARVLLAGNIIKAVGIMLLLFGIDPVISYGIVGIGAVMYSPAKYGILPELTDSPETLHNANSKIEAYTILSIIAGGAAGGILAEYSLAGSMILCVVLYAASIAATFLIPVMKGNSEIRYGAAAAQFFSDLKTLVKSRRAQFSLVGTASFWMTSSLLRLAAMAWIPVALAVKSEGLISLLLATTGIGIVAGSLMTPRLVHVQKFYNAYIYGWLMAVSIFLSIFNHNVFMAVALLLVIGFLGGVYIVPMNTALQQVGQNTIGNGRTIAAQNFVNNSVTLLGVGGYSALVRSGVSPTYTIVVIVAVTSIFLIVLHVKVKGVIKEMRVRGFNS